MKSILLTVGLAFIGMYATAQTRVIDYPVMGQRTTDALEFYQAEVSDTAVILRGDMYSRPNYWVRIASSSVSYPFPSSSNASLNFPSINATVGKFVIPANPSSFISLK